MKRILIIATACAVVAAAPAANAQAERLRPGQMKVTSAGLDLATADGAELMLGRLQRAAVWACGERPLISPLAPHAVRQFGTCRTRVLARLVAELDQPVVTSRFATRSDWSVRLASRGPAPILSSWRKAR